MDVCKCIVPSWHGGTLNSRRAANPLLRLMEGEERREAPDHSRVVRGPLNWGGTELNRSVTSTRGLLATDHVILNHGQVTWTTPELAPPHLLTTTPLQREDVSALDRFNVHRCPTRRVFSGTGLELVTKQATVRYLYHSATAATTKMSERHYVLRASNVITVVIFTCGS
ncbi:uncharacterized protein TNCV_3870551 [Trichonephila clavipes]|nr:uncharacterized protein TNCV_3870551 [Trichonephila clavipes]